MAEHSNNIWASAIVCSFAVLVSLVSGILSGMAQDWMRMSLFFCGSVLTAFGSATGIAMLKYAARFKLVEDRLGQPERPLPRAHPAIAFGLVVLEVVSVAICMSLAVVALFRRDAFGLGICLTTCGMIVVICSGVAIVLGARVRCERLEALISANGGVSDARSHTTESS